MNSTEVCLGLLIEGCKHPMGEIVEKHVLSCCCCCCHVVLHDGLYDALVAGSRWSARREPVAYPAGSRRGRNARRVAVRLPPSADLPQEPVRALQLADVLADG